MFKADVPGVKKDDLEINSSGNRIQISGKRDSEKETKSETVCQEDPDLDRRRDVVTSVRVESC